MGKILEEIWVRNALLLVWYSLHLWAWACCRHAASSDFVRITRLHGCVLCESIRGDRPRKYWGKCHEVAGSDLYSKKSALYRTNTILVLVGDDFWYISVDKAEAQFRNHWMLSDYIDSNPRLKGMVDFGTLQDYFRTLREELKELIAQCLVRWVCCGSWLPSLGIPWLMPRWNMTTGAVILSAGPSSRPWIWFSSKLSMPL